MNKLFTKYIDLLEGWEDIDSDSLDKEEQVGVNTIESNIIKLCELFEKDGDDFNIRGNHLTLSAEYVNQGGFDNMHIKLFNDGELINHQFFNYTIGQHSCWLRKDAHALWVNAVTNDWNKTFDDVTTEYQNCRYHIWNMMVQNYYNKKKDVTKLKEGWDDIDSDALDDEENEDSGEVNDSFTLDEFMQDVSAIYRDVFIHGWRGFSIGIDFIRFIKSGDGATLKINFRLNGNTLVSRYDDSKHRHVIYYQIANNSHSNTLEALQIFDRQLHRYLANNNE